MPPNIGWTSFFWVPYFIPKPQKRLWMEKLCVSSGTGTILHKDQLSLLLWCQQRLLKTDPDFFSCGRSCPLSWQIQEITLRKQELQKLKTSGPIIASMYCLFIYIYPKIYANVGDYTNMDPMGLKCGSKISMLIWHSATCFNDTTNQESRWLLDQTVLSINGVSFPKVNIARHKGGWLKSNQLSMYGMFTYIYCTYTYHKNQPSVGKYNIIVIHGSYG